MYYASKVGLKTIYKKICYFHKKYRKFASSHTLYLVLK